MKKIFISYSHNDFQAKENLLNELNGLRNAGVIEVWDDTSIVIGDEWDDTIKNNLNDADVIVLLISKSFLESKYIHEVELSKAAKRHKKGKVKVLPILLEECNWMNVEFLKGIQLSPVKEGRTAPINTFDPLRNGYKQAADDIAKALKEKKSRLLFYLLSFLVFGSIAGYIAFDQGLFQKAPPPIVLTVSAAQPLNITPEKKVYEYDELILKDSAKIIVDKKCDFFEIKAKKTSIGKMVSIDLSGVHGTNGQNGGVGGGGSPGKNGGSGADGKPGTHATHAKSANFRFENIQTLGDMTISAFGGNGGKGGNGGAGGNGGRANCSGNDRGGDGGSGGNGANGGNAGDGGNIKIFYSFSSDFTQPKTIEDYFKVNNKTGSLGAGGTAGSGGGGGSGKRCGIHKKGGGNGGSAGAPGQNGAIGKSGRLNFDELNN